jgi:hypothetical protein
VPSAFERSSVTKPFESIAGLKFWMSKSPGAAARATGELKDTAQSVAAQAHAARTVKRAGSIFTSSPSPLAGPTTSSRP